MKKFLLKGKQLLSKKLQQFDIQTVGIDYVGDQTPSRLKQSLSVLRDNQIDLQDNHEYETYFKNYPNHHISHFLLDKFKSNKNIKEQPTMKLEQDSQNNEQWLPYHPPPNPNTYIPPFNPSLQNMALTFKNSIEQYEQIYNKVEKPLLCVCVIHFHHKRGTEIEYCYPKDKIIEKVSEHIVHHAMPDSSHLRDEDFNYFNFEVQLQAKKRMLFGVSYFKQIKVTQQMKKVHTQLTRSHVQKAITIISTVPLFEYIKIHLESTTPIFFQNFTDYSIVKQAYTQINKNLEESWPNIQLPDLYMGCNLRQIVENFGVSNLYEIWKALIYEKRVVVFAQTSSDASSFILSLLSLFPGLSAFGICSKPISRYLQSLRQYSLPLRMFSSKNFLSISFHVQDFHKLSKFSKNSQGNFLLGTTNKLLKQTNDYGIQMLINLTDNTVIKNKPRRPWQQLTKKQKIFINDLKQNIDSLQSMANQKQNNSCNQEIQDTIRGCFHQFLKNVLVQMIVGMRDYQLFAIQCEKYEKAMKKVEKNQQIKKNGSYDLMQEEQDYKQSNNSQQPLQFPPTFPTSTSQLVLPELLLNKSFAYFRQFHNIWLPQIISGKQLPSVYINNYEYLLRLDPNQKQNQQYFICYNWLQKRLTFGKGQPLFFDGKEIKYRYNSNLEIVKEGQGNNRKEVTRSIYIGMVQNGRYSKNGFYVDRHQYYEGEFANGLKNGYGKFYTITDKYIGNFANNLYEGEGQLVKNGEVYVGSFRNGLKHGLGSLQGNQAIVGEWTDDKFIPENQRIEANKKQKSTGSKGSSRKGSEQQKM